MFLVEQKTFLMEQETLLMEQKILQNEQKMFASENRVQSNIIIAWWVTSRILRPCVAFLRLRMVFYWWMDFYRLFLRARS